MNRAVMNPQAMNAAMFGMIMPLRNVPNLWTATRAPPGRFVSGDVVVMHGASLVVTTRRCRPW